MCDGTVLGGAKTAEKNVKTGVKPQRCASASKPAAASWRSCRARARIYNPIEGAFSKLKTFLRRLQARTRKALEAAIDARGSTILFAVRRRQSGSAFVLQNLNVPGVKYSVRRLSAR